jgi:solute carrier family 25 2-oxodicarboxylate transporter 21
MIPKNAVQFGVYDQTKRCLEAHNGGPSASIELFSALVCSVPEAMIFTPFQVVKVRLQTKEHLGRYRNTLHCFRAIFQHEGARILFGLGLPATILRNQVWNGVYFPTMYFLRPLMTPARSGSLKEDKVIATMRSLLAGFLGGSLATCFNCPLDVVKSRIQSQLSMETNSGKSCIRSGSIGIGIRGTSSRPHVYRYTHTLPSLLHIFRMEGLAGCYRGFSPKLLRMGIGGGIAAATFEIVQSEISKCS